MSDSENNCFSKMKVYVSEKHTGNLPTIHSVLIQPASLPVEILLTLN